MSFLQIIEFHTDRVEELTALDDEWAAATAGERTIVGSQLYADRSDPTHYFALSWFADYASAMVNSGLPATSEFAKKAMALTTGDATFIDLDPAGPAGMQGEPELRRSLESGTFDRNAFTDDLVVDLIVPNSRVVVTGVDAVEVGMAAEAPGRVMEMWDAQPTPSGFVVEYAYRTTGPAPILSVGTVLATIRDGRIARLLVTCGGNWDAATEAEIRERTGSFGPQLTP